LQHDPNSGDCKHPSGNGGGGTSKEFYTIRQLKLGQHQPGRTFRE
jgi:hypothetical protein